MRAMKNVQSVRIARPSDDLKALIPFYRDGLGLTVLGSFSDHDGFDGIMLGVPGANYHFEFTHKRGHVAGRAPSQDNLAVFYLPDRAVYEATIASMQRAGFQPVVSFNPYWDAHGRTFEDPDGYRVVLQNASWDA